MGYRGDLAAFMIERAKLPAAPRKTSEKAFELPGFLWLVQA
jgi:hypothetical protein